MNELLSFEESQTVSAQFLAKQFQYSSQSDFLNRAFVMVCFRTISWKHVGDSNKLVV